MKKIIIALVATIIVSGFSVESFAQLQLKNAIMVDYDQIALDATFRYFKRANKANQIEILNHLVTRANEEYLECKTIEDLYYLKEQVGVIKFYNSHAKKPSIATSNALTRLDRKITQTEAEYKKAKVISKPLDVEYTDPDDAWGRDDKKR